MAVMRCGQTRVCKQASANAVDVTITQKSATHTWSGYRFSQFSDWLNIYAPGRCGGAAPTHPHSTRKSMQFVAALCLP